MLDAVATLTEAQTARGVGRFQEAIKKATVTGAKIEEPVVSTVRETARKTRDTTTTLLRETGHLGGRIGGTLWHVQETLVGLVTDKATQEQIGVAIGEMVGDANDVVHANVERVKDYAREQRDLMVAGFTGDMRKLGGWSKENIVQPTVAGAKRLSRDVRAVGIPGVAVGVAAHTAPGWAPQVLEMITAYGPMTAGALGAAGGAAVGGLAAYRGAEALGRWVRERYRQPIAEIVQVAKRVPEAVRVSSREARRQTGVWGDRFWGAVNSQANEFASWINGGTARVVALYHEASASGSEVRAAFQESLKPEAEEVGGVSMKDVINRLNTSASATRDVATARRAMACKWWSAVGPLKAGIMSPGEVAAPAPLLTPAPGV